MSGEIIGIVLVVVVALIFLFLFSGRGAGGMRVRTHERSRCRTSLDVKGKKRLFWILILIAAFVAVRFFVGSGVRYVVMERLL